MRVPQEAVPIQKHRRYGLWILVGLAVLVIVVVIAQGAAGFYFDYLWFRAYGLDGVWRTMLTSKLGLSAAFVIVAFAVTYTNLWLIQKAAPPTMFLGPEHEGVRRFQAAVAPHAMAVRVAVSVLIGLALGAGASSQWKHWILFEHAVRFGRVDSLFHRDVSFFIFRLPLLSFLVDWFQVLLVVMLIVAVVGHMLNAAVRIEDHVLHVESRAIAHFSLILGGFALVRAWAYYYVDRFTLELGHDGVVAGASYTDIHVRLPAMTLLAVVSLAAFVMLVVNAYQRTFVLPIIAVGLWSFLAIAIGVIYPAVVQAFQVTPAQSSLELPSIRNNIDATRYAMGINSVSTTPFPANQDLTPGIVQHYKQVLDDAPLWDPRLTRQTFAALEGLKDPYALTPLALDRYTTNGVVVPAVVGVRSLSSSGGLRQSWVSTHLQYTHGEGAIVAQANRSDAEGNPQFLLGNLPPTAKVSSLSLDSEGARVYYAPGETQYVVGDTRQAEVDYQSRSGTTVTGHYAGQGINIGSFEARATAAIHLHDFSLLVSNFITPHSKLVYMPDVVQRAQNALQFLKVSTKPYALVVNRQIYWMLDGYTTSAYYPNAQPADSAELPYNSALQGSYNYVRDAVKIVENASTGVMTFYALPGNDPLMKSYELAFPHLFRPLAKMPKVLLAHLRYPQSLLMLQSAAYGLYHVTNPSTFYDSSQAWQLSETSTSSNGRPTSALPYGPGGVAPYEPEYELLELPGQTRVGFDLVEALVPYSPTDSHQTLTSLVIATSDASDYGDLQTFNTPSNKSIKGPGLVNAETRSNKQVSADITPLDLGGSVVSLGNVVILPIADSLIYIRPLYVSSSQTAFPQLQDVIVAYGNDIQIAPTLDQALAEVFGSSISGSGRGKSGSPVSSAAIPVQVRQLVDEASSEYQAAAKALAHGDLGVYQADTTKASKLIAQARALLDVVVPATVKSKTKTATSSSKVTGGIRSSKTGIRGPGAVGA